MKETNDHFNRVVTDKKLIRCLLDEARLTSCSFKTQKQDGGAQTLAQRFGHVVFKFKSRDLKKPHHWIIKQPLKIIQQIQYQLLTVITDQ